MENIIGKKVMELSNKSKEVPLKKLLPLMPTMIFLSSCNPKSSLSDAEWVAGALILSSVLLALGLLRL